MTWDDKGGDSGVGLALGFLVLWIIGIIWYVYEWAEKGRVQP